MRRSWENHIPVALSILVGFYVKMDVPGKRVEIWRNGAEIISQEGDAHIRETGNWDRIPFLDNSDLIEGWRA